MWFGIGVTTVDTVETLTIVGSTIYFLWLFVMWAVRINIMFSMDIESENKQLLFIFIYLFIEHYLECTTNQSKDCLRVHFDMINKT